MEHPRELVPHPQYHTVEPDYNQILPAPPTLPRRPPFNTSPPRDPHGTTSDTEEHPVAVDTYQQRALHNTIINLFRQHILLQIITILMFALTVLFVYIMIVIIEFMSERDAIQSLENCADLYHKVHTRFT